MPEEISKCPLDPSAVHNEDEVVYQPAQIGCSLSAVFMDARPGERIFFDDVKIGGVISDLHHGGGEPRLEVQITHAANGTAKLRAEKDINLPDTKIENRPAGEASETIFRRIRSSGNLASDPGGAR